MNYNQEEIDNCAKNLIELRTKSSKDPILRKEYQLYFSFCVREKFKPLVDMRVSRYKSFSNFKDLEQEGYEALLMSLKTYKPSKGSFTWWAGEYISTRVSRAANAHSTIRIPIKKAKETKPFKVSTIPIIVDGNPNPFQSLESLETTSFVIKAVSELPEPQRKIVSAVYGLRGIKPQPVSAISEALSISRPQCLKLLKEARIKLKEKLQNSFI